MATTVVPSLLRHEGPFGHAARSLVALFLELALAACAVPISYYDGTTYTNLTGLKAETTMLIESFDAKPLAKNESKIDATTLSFRKSYEYEKGKGAPNSDTVMQFEKIRGLYEQTIEEYRANGPGVLGPKYFQEAARLLGQAFDIAIATENLKNKDKR
jgi:hypothetical protein